MRDTQTTAIYTSEFRREFDADTAELLPVHLRWFAAVWGSVQVITFLIHWLGRLIEEVRADGVTIVFISHFLDDVLAISDRITVFRNGRKVVTEDTAKLTKDALLRNLDIAEKLGCLDDAGLAEMKPLRVVTPGALTTFPMRMLAAGAGAKVGIQLFVITEGAIRVKGFPGATIDPAATDMANVKSASV